MSTIAVDWPDGGHLSETMWRRRLEDLADRAESLLTNHDATLQDRATLAVQWLGLCWSGFSPATIAASARGSLLVGENIVVAPAPADQIAERLAMLWQQADADPAAAVEVAMVMLERGPVPDYVPGTRQRRPKAKVLELEPEAVEAADLEPADLSDMPEAEFVALCPQGHHGTEAVEPEPAPLEPDDLGIDAQLGPAVEALEPAPAPAPAPPEPAPPAPAAPAPDTSGWLTVLEAAELLEVSVTTLGRWRLDGQLGQEGRDWVRHGRTFLFAPGGPIEAAMDRLAAQREARANAVPRPGPRTSDCRPPGWLTPDEAAAKIGISGSRVRQLITAGNIPSEAVFRVGLRSQWLDPAVVELLAQKKPPGDESEGAMNSELTA